MRAPAYACRRVVPKNGMSSSDQSAKMARRRRFELLSPKTRSPGQDANVRPQAFEDSGSETQVW